MIVYKSYEEKEPFIEIFDVFTTHAMLHFLGNLNSDIKMPKATGLFNVFFKK